MGDLADQRERLLAIEAITRLTAIAQRDTGQSRRVANFLLAWHNAAENGGWDITDLWGIDTQIAHDILAVLHMIHSERRYPGELGFEREMQAIWELWRGNQVWAVI